MHSTAFGIPLGRRSAAVIRPGAPRIVARILVIDDDAFFRSVFCRILEGGGHSVIEAEDGIQGIEIYKEHRPDVTIVDIFMPEIDGTLVIQRLKEFDSSARIIAISGRSVFYNIDFGNTVKRLGAAGILRKLDSKDVILAEVAKVLRTAGQ
jgi:CheY-like chemotaxis protein